MNAATPTGTPLCVRIDSIPARPRGPVFTLTPTTSFGRDAAPPITIGTPTVSFLSRQACPLHVEAELHHVAPPGNVTTVVGSPARSTTSAARYSSATARELRRFILGPSGGGTRMSDITPARDLVPDRYASFPMLRLFLPLIDANDQTRRWSSYLDDGIELTGSTDWFELWNRHRESPAAFEPDRGMHTQN